MNFSLHRRAGVVGVVVAVALLFLVVGTPTARAATIDFTVISQLDPAATSIVEDQLGLSISAGDPGEVVFRFHNSGPEPATIGQVYIDDMAAPDSLLVGVSDLQGSNSGVQFSVGPAGVPGASNLPGGNNIGFAADFMIGALASPVQNGVNPGEYLDVTFAMQPGKDVTDVISAMRGLDMRAGMHVLGIGEDGVSASLATIPEPGSFAALALGSMALLGLRPRRRSSSQVSRRMAVPLDR